MRVRAITLYAIFASNKVYNTFNEYKEIVNHFNTDRYHGGSDINPILKYFLIFNAMFTMVNKYYYDMDIDRHCNGFDSLICFNNTKIVNNIPMIIMKH